MSDIARLGFSVDTQGLKKGEKALDSFAKTGESTEKRTDNSSKKIIKDFEGIEKAVGKTAAEVVRAERETAKAHKLATKELAKRSRGFGQAGIQVQQFVGQVQGGQGIMLAFSQQSADLGIVLGAPLLGAVAGISASLIGLLIPTLLSANKEVENLTKNTDKLIQTFSKLNDAQKLIAQQGLQEELKGQVKRFGELFNEVQKLEKEVVVSRRQERRGGIVSLMFDPEQTNNELVASKLALSTLSIELEKTAEQIRSLAEDNVNKTAIDETIEALQKQANMYGANERAAALFEASVLGANSAQLLAISSTFDLIDAKKQEIEATKEATALNKLVGNITSSIEKQVIALRDGANASLEFTVAKRLGLAEDKKIPEVIQKQIDALTKLKKAKKEAADNLKDIKKLEVARKQEAKDFEKLTKEIDNFGGTWTKTGSIIVDVFGDISDAMNDYMSQLREIESNEKSLAEARKKEGANFAEITRLQSKLESDRIGAELSGLKAASKAGESLFDEKTAAAKSFAALNKIITIAEIALSFQKMAAGTVEAGVHVANETTKQGANALTAITSAFAAPFPINFVAGAAMIGIMANLLGGAFGGGGGGSFDATESRQEAQGTGTVFGSDEKSQSILESQERFENLQIDQLSELRGIRSSLDSLSLGISQLAGSIVVGNIGEFGGQTGEISRSFAGFSSTKKKVIDQGINFIGQSLGDIIDGGILQAQAFFDVEKTKSSFFGLSKSTSLKTEFQSIDEAIQNQMADIFGFIGDTVLQSAKLLGFETTTILKQSFSESDFLDNENIKDFLIGRFTSVFTEVEVSLEEALSQFQVNIGKVSLEGLSGEEIEAELQAVFSKQADLIAEFLVPSIAEYQKIGEGLFDTLTRVTKEQVVFNSNIERMGFDLSALSNVIQIDVAQSIIQLIGGLDNFTEASNSFFENFFTEAEQFEQLESSLGEAFDSLGLSMSGSREEFRALIEGIDLTTESGQALFAALLELNPALSEFFDELEQIERQRTSLQIELLKLQGNAEEALALQREIQLAGMDESLITLQLLIFAEEDRIVLLKEQQQEVRNSFGMLEKAIDLEKQRATAIFDISKMAHDAEILRIDNLRTALDAENELRKQNLASAESALNDSFNAEMKRIQDSANTEISLIQEISNIRVEALTDERSAISATASSMKLLVNTINSSLGLSGSTNLIAALAGARGGDFSKAQALDVAGLAKLDPSGFSSAEDLAVQQAINQNRLKEISDLAGSQLSESERMLAAIEMQIEATQSSSENQINAIRELTENQVTALQEQLNSLLGIDSSVLSVNEAINEFGIAQQELDSLNYDLEQQKLDMLVESANEVFALHEQGYADELERLDAILDDNEELLNAALGIDASVLSVAEAITALNNSIFALAAGSGGGTSIPASPFAPVVNGNNNQEAKQEETINVLKSIREDNLLVQRELVKNTKSTARILQRIEINGIDTRSID